MKVVIQRPVLGAAPGSRHFVDTVFEVKLRSLEVGDSGGWCVLEGLEEQPSGDPYGLPILHKGFFDSHLHMTWSGLFAQDLDLRSAPDLESAVRLIEARLATGAPFVRGYGWDESKWNMTLGSAARMCETKLPEDKPVILYRVCGHSALVNRALRELAGRPELGAWVTDRDIPSLAEQLPAPSSAECEAAFLRAQTEAIRNGITSVGDMALDETTVASIRNLAAEGKLLIDVAGVIEGGKAPSVEAHGPFEVKNSVSVGPLDRPAHFSVRHWKKFLDGSLGSRTAWLSRPYEDQAVVGEQLCELDALVEASREALAEGFHLSFHAIGDAALDQALDVGERLRSLLRGVTEGASSFAFQTRHRLEHTQIVRDDQVRRLVEQTFWTLCVQPNHRVEDAAFIRDRLGAQRYLETAYRAGGLVRAGVPITLGSDAPVAALAPAKVLEAVMTHEQASENLHFSEAMWCYTTGARLALGLHPGRLAVGSTVFVTFPPVVPTGR